MRVYLGCIAVIAALALWVGPRAALAQRTGAGAADQQANTCKEFLENAEPEKAEAACREAILADPNHYDARRALIAALLAQAPKVPGKLQAALSEANASLELGKSNDDLALFQGIAIFEAARQKVAGAQMADAIPLLERGSAGTKAPEPAALALASLCQYYVYEPSYAAKSAEACVAFRKKRPDNEIFKALDTTILEKLAYAHLALKDYASMFTACDELARVGTGLQKSIGQMCTGYAQALKGDCTGAIRRLELLTNLNSPQVFRPLTSCYLKTTPPRLADAQRTAEKYKQAKPKDAKAYLLLAEVYAKQKRYNDALRELTLAAQYARDSVEVRVIKADILIGQKRFVEAGVELESARKLTPEDVSLHVRTAQLYVQELKQPKHALSILEPVLATGDRAGPPEVRSTLRALEGYAHLSLGDGPKGIASLEEAMRLDPKAAGLKQRFISHLVGLGVTSAEKKKFAEAEAYLIKAQKHDPRSVYANRNLGVLYLLQKKPEKALAPLESWREASGQRDRDSNLLLARALALLGKTAAAMQALETARDAITRASKTPQPGPVLAEILVELGPLQLQMNQADAAVATLELARINAEGDPKLRLAASRNLALSYLARSRIASRTPEQAAADLEAAVQLEGLSGGEKSGVVCALALAHLELGQAGKALDELQAAQKTGGCRFKAPYDKLGVDFWTAYALYRAGKQVGLEKAIETFRGLGSKATGPLAQNLKEVLQAAYVRYAVELYDNGDDRGALHRAEASLKNASKIAAKDEGRQRDLKHNLAVLDLAAGNTAAAKGVFEKLGQSPREAAVNLGLIALRQGALVNALELWRRSGSRLARVREWIDVAERFLGTPSSAGATP